MLLKSKKLSEYLAITQKFKQNWRPFLEPVFSERYKSIHHKTHNILLAFLNKSHFNEPLCGMSGLNTGRVLCFQA